MSKKEQTLELLLKNNEAKLSDKTIADMVKCPPASVAWYRTKLNCGEINGVPKQTIQCWNKDEKKRSKFSMTGKPSEAPEPQAARYCKMYKKKVLPDQCFKHWTNLCQKSLDKFKANGIISRPMCVAQNLSKEKA